MWWVVASALLAGCSTPIMKQCLDAEKAGDAEGERVCELAYQRTYDSRAVGAGSHLALMASDEVELYKWLTRAPNDIEGARAMHFLAEEELERGNRATAKALFRRALEIRKDRDPIRAANTALALFDAIRSSEPAEESIRVAQIAWEQAELANATTVKAFTAVGVVDLLLDLGESETADRVARTIDQNESASLSDYANGRIAAARGRFRLAASLFERASKIGGTWTTTGALDLVEAHLDNGNVKEARAVFDSTKDLVETEAAGRLDAKCRLAAVSARLSLGEDAPRDALRVSEAALATGCRDSARANVLEIQAGALARLDRPREAEAAWREAASSIEIWRASIPSTELRRGVVAQHRRALEHWLDLAGSRADVGDVARVADLLLGRALHDRLLDHEAASGDPEVLLGGVVGRLEHSRAIDRLSTPQHALIDVDRDLTVFLVGFDSIWSLRHHEKRWTVRRVGRRADVLGMILKLKELPDDPSASAALGKVLFADNEIPDAGTTMLVLLDGPLSGIELPALRVNDSFLIEKAVISEVLTPELLFRRAPEVGAAPDLILGDPTSDLDGGYEEAKFVGSIVGVEPKVRSSATKAALLTSGRSRLLHISAHSRIERGTAEFVLADGTVTSAELLQSAVSPTLAVIATCNSERGDDPTVSLAAAFLANGSVNVVGAKRPLADRYAAAILVDFYRNGGIDAPARALAIAQRLAIRRGVSPRVWGGLAVFGQ